MAQRKAVIGSRAGGVVEMAVEGETGLTLGPRDWKTQAHSTMELSCSVPRRTDGPGWLSAPSLVDPFTTEQYKSQIHETYRAVISGRSLPTQIGVPAPSGSR